MAQGQVEAELDCYLVGGAVRDELLGRHVRDRDWVVVGSSAEQMLALGFLQVGRDFPVFLHPVSHEEYALARIERKQGRGHQGFVVEADPSVTLEEDLSRRDLTINAIAKRPNGDYVDPFHGRADLQAKQLKHVSSAFIEDPLRVLRVARFAAQLPGFGVDKGTQDLMEKLAQSGELSSLSAERIWQETERALGYVHAAQYFIELHKVQGLNHWFPELEGSFERIGREAMGKLFSKHASAMQRFAQLPLTLTEFKQLGRRIKTPTSVLQLALDSVTYRDVVAQPYAASVEQLYDTFAALRVWHDSNRLRAVIAVLELGEGITVKQHAADILCWADEMSAIKVGVNEEGLTGPAFGEALRAARIQWLLAQR